MFMVFLHFVIPAEWFLVGNVTDADYSSTVTKNKASHFGNYSHSIMEI